MTSFSDWADANSVTKLTSHPTFDAQGVSAWARTDRDEYVYYGNDGVSLVTQTWNPHGQNYMATSKVLGRATAASGVVEELTYPWPVNSVFFGAVDTSPVTLLGLGTWVSLATGLLLVGSASFTVYTWKRTA